MPHNSRTLLVCLRWLAGSIVLVMLVAVGGSLLTPNDSAAGFKDCSQPVTSGTRPIASDCLYILKAAVHTVTCEPECICAPKGSLPITASDALVCLRYVVGQPVELNCPCTLPTTTTLPGATTTTVPGGTTTTVPGGTTTTVPGGGTTTTTTLPVGAFSCSVDTAGCTTTACACGQDPGFDYHIGHSTGKATGPVGTLFDVNTQVAQGGTIDCGGWTRVDGSVMPSCDVLGCCRRDEGQPETANWSVFEIYDLPVPCACPFLPNAGDLRPNILIQCQLPPNPLVLEHELQATGCP